MNTKTQATHTPGPWHLVDHRGPLINDVAIFGYDKSLVARVLTGDKQADANAHLIAAAPDLLEVVKRHLDFCGLKNCPTCKMAEATITKVESEGRRNKP